MTDYHPVTREELNMIKNDCAYPEKPYCEGCAYCDENEDITRASGLGCQFKGANVLMEEVLSRPDPLALLVAWFKWYCTTHDTNIGLKDAVRYMIIQSRTNPEAVRQRGIEEGWWE